jgi:hypothetical protein
MSTDVFSKQKDRDYCQKRTGNNDDDFFKIEKLLVIFTFQIKSQNKIRNIKKDQLMKQSGNQKPEGKQKS